MLVRHLQNKQTPALKYQIHTACWCPRPVVRRPDEPLVIDDIAYNSEKERNADACTSRDCMWGKSSDGLVYVPFVIASHYCKHWTRFNPLQVYLKEGFPSCLYKLPVKEKYVRIYLFIQQ